MLGTEMEPNHETMSFNPWGLRGESHLKPTRPEILHRGLKTNCKVKVLHYPKPPETKKIILSKVLKVKRQTPTTGLWLKPYEHNQGIVILKYRSFFLSIGGPLQSLLSGKLDLANPGCF